MTIAFIDTETTGLDPERDHIWEIAVIVAGDERVWQQRIPDAQGHFSGPPDWDVVDDWVVENTGIRDRYNHGAALHPESSIALLSQLVVNRHLVGACPWFDSERLHRVLLDVDARSGGQYQRGLPWHYHLIDIEALAVGYLLGKGSQMASPQDWYTPLPWKSDELSLRVGVDPADFKPKHSALADARWAKAVYEAVTSCTEG